MILDLAYAPKVRILQTLYFYANCLGKPITVNELVKKPLLHDYREKPDSLRQRLATYCNDLVSKERINGLYHWMLTEKGIERLRYFWKKIDGDPSYMREPKRIIFRKRLRRTLLHKKSKRI